LAASAAGAAAVGTLVGSLIGLGIPEEEAEVYHAHVVEGRTIVTVKTDERYPEAVQILESHGGHVSFPYSGSVAPARESDAVARGTRSAGVEPVHASDEQSIGEPIESMPVEETTSGVTSRSVRVDRASIGSAKTPSERAGEVPTDARPNEFDRPA